MDIVARVAGWFSGRTTQRAAAPSRRERRAAARRRHHETGAPLWTKADLEEGPVGTREVADVAPGTPGHFGSVRVEDEQGRRR
jgi:hypothetical protein